MAELLQRYVQLQDKKQSPELSNAVYSAFLQARPEMKFDFCAGSEFQQCYEAEKVVGVVGGRLKGKTYVINRMCDMAISTSLEFKAKTELLSLYYYSAQKIVFLQLLDCFAPESSPAEKCRAQLLLEYLCAVCSDIIVVVGSLSAEEQLFIKKLTMRPTPSFFVVHNYQFVSSRSKISWLVANQVEKLFKAEKYKGFYRSSPREVGGKIKYLIHFVVQEEAPEAGIGLAFKQLKNIFITFESRQFQFLKGFKRFATQFMATQLLSKAQLTSGTPTIITAGSKNMTLHSLTWSCLLPLSDLEGSKRRARLLRGIKEVFSAETSTLEFYLQFPGDFELTNLSVFAEREGQHCLQFSLRDKEREVGRSHQFALDRMRLADSEVRVERRMGVWRMSVRLEPIKI